MIYLARAPSGVVSSGPVVIDTRHLAPDETVNDILPTWHKEGPFVLATDIDDALRDPTLVPGWACDPIANGLRERGLV